MKLNLSSQTWLTFTWLGVMGLTVFLAWITYQSNLLLKKYRPDFNLLLSLPELLARFILVGICFLLIWSSGLTTTQLGLISPAPFYSLGLGIGLGVIIQIAVNLITYGAIKYFGEQIYSPIVVQSIVPRSLGQWPAVGLALIPAVAMEELLFRTLWLGAFALIIPLPWLILGTSVIFGFMHQPQGLLGVVLTSSINVLLCLLFVWTGQLLVPFVTHYMVNLLQLAVAYWQIDWLDDYPSPAD